MMDSLVWPIIVGLPIVVLLIVVFAFVVTLQRAEMRKALGLPPDSKLGDRHKRMFHAFEETDVRLSKKLRYLLKGQREALAREILREKWLLPKKTQKGR